MTNWASSRQFRLIADYDENWYVIPADREGEFFVWVEDEEGDKSLPGWMESVDGPEGIVFDEWERVDD